MKKDPLIGQRLANFRVDRPLGRGGMAQVYYGIDTSLERPVAIKVIDARYQGDPEYARRFVDEAKLVARWRHEHIVQVYYAGNVGDLYFFAMEYIDGASLEGLLESYLQEGSLIPHEDVLRIGGAIASALDYAHKQGVIHRDIKPSNIMISRDERVVLMDFGLALDMGQGSMGQVFGTPHYISPEQARKSSAATAQSDIYSLGVVLYEMLTGAIPFDDPSASSVAVQHITMPPPAPTLLNPALNQEIEDVLLKALAKEPGERYPNATAMLDALNVAIASLAKPTKDSLTVMPPALAARGVRLSRKSISDMLELDLDANEPTTSLHKANPVHSLETQETRVPPKTTRPAKQTAAREMKSSSEKTLSNPAQTQKMKPETSKNNSLLIMLGSAVVTVLVVVLVLVLMNMMQQTPATITADETATEATLLAEAELAASQTEQTLREAATEEPSFEPSPTENTAATAESLALTKAANNLELTNAAATGNAVIQGDSIATATSIVLTNEAVMLANTSVAATNNAIQNAQTQTANDALATSQAIAVAQTQSANNALATSNVLVEASLTVQPQASPAAQATTAAYPSGPLLELTYNNAGFYLRNSSDVNVRLSRLRFTALNASGTAVGNEFNGIDWTRFYNSVDRNGRCVVIELLDQSSWTRPNNCVAASGSAFNSQLTFPTNDQRIFWDGRNAASQFAVYWNDQEVGRCAIADGFCAIRVGN